MQTSRIKTQHAHGEVYPNVFADFDWVKTHHDKLLAQYGECVLLVYEAQVIGTGDTPEAAIQDAEARLPADSPTITPIIAPLYEHYRVRRVFTDADLLSNMVQKANS